MRTGALDALDKRTDVYIGGNRWKEVILMMGNDHVISILSPFVVWVYSEKYIIPGLTITQRNIF